MEELLDKILEIIKGKQFPEVTSTFFGDPITYPSFTLPAIAVCPLGDKIQAYTMAKDNHDIVARIYVIRSVRDGFNQVTNESPVDRFLVSTAEDIVAALREDVTLGGTVAVFQNASVQYAPAVRGQEAVRMARIDAVFKVTKSRSR